MKLLITGASGFVGNNLVSYFVNKNYDVTGVYWKTIPNLKESSRCKLVKMDLSQNITLGEHFDAIIHTACIRPGKDISYYEYIKGNVSVAKNLVDFAEENSIPFIVNFSSRSIYGTVRESEICENADRINQDAYGTTKYQAECILNESKAVSTINLRVPGITGPGAHDTWLVETVNKIVRDESVIVTDYYTRNFVWLDDIANFIDVLVKTYKEEKSELHQTINLSCEIGAQNIEIIKEIVQRTKSKSRIEIVPANGELFYLNSDKARKLGFKSHSVMEIVDLYLDSLGY